MKANEEVNEKLRKILEPKLKRHLSTEELALAALNLKGFASTLIKMKMEIDKNVGISG
ncbi:MAG: hypothetical protein WD231_04420 [Candidatus Woykebacteria bacterium]